MIEAELIPWNRYVIDGIVMKPFCEYNMEQALRECQYIIFVWEPEEEKCTSCYRDVEKKLALEMALQRHFLLNSSLASVNCCVGGLLLNVLLMSNLTNKFS